MASNASSIAAKSFTLLSVFLHILLVAATPLRRDLNNELVVTEIVTVTATLYATLIPPALPAVTVSATYTQSLYSRTSTLNSVINCTTTLYSPIVAPVNVTAAASPTTLTSATTSVKPPGLDILEDLERRQAPTSPSLTTTSTTPTQRPAFTRTIYSILSQTEAVPFIRTAYACSATLEVFHSIITDLVTSTVSRTLGLVLRLWLALPSVGPSTAVFSATARQTRVNYVVTTISEIGPSTRVIRACSPTVSASITTTAK
ncbi:hypothetical protein BDZ45DRAFT_745664 [Acephala macrosclerotiorum]|nr:hypothetical protein BDZ45DRAFT_745664 [Acephala macrosclerotiorum]